MTPDDPPFSQGPQTKEPRTIRLFHRDFGELSAVLPLNESPMNAFFGLKMFLPLDSSQVSRSSVLHLLSWILSGLPQALAISHTLRTQGHARRRRHWQVRLLRKIPSSPQRGRAVHGTDTPGAVTPGPTDPLMVSGAHQTGKYPLFRLTFPVLRFLVLSLGSFFSTGPGYR